MKFTECILELVCPDNRLPYAYPSVAGSPGNIYRFTFDPSSDVLDESINLSMHDINFIDALRAGRGVYGLPKEIVMLGIEPRILECSLGLSQELNNALPKIIEAVKSELY